MIICKINAEDQEEFSSIYKKLSIYKVNKRLKREDTNLDFNLKEIDLLLTISDHFKRKYE